MAIEIPGFNPGCFKAKQSLVDQQFRGVYLSGNFEIDKVTDGTKAANAIGVLQDKPLLGEGGNVMTNGITKAEAHSTTTAGDKVKYHTDGTLVTTVSGRYNGIALEGAEASQIFSMLFESGSL